MKDLTTSISTHGLSADLNVDHQDVVGAAKSLENDGMIVCQLTQVQQWKLSDEAQELLKKGSPEFILWTKLAVGPIEQCTLVSEMGKQVMDVALANGMKLKLFLIVKDGESVRLSRNPAVKEFDDQTQHVLRDIVGGKHVDPKESEGLKKRKLASLEAVKGFILTKGPNFAHQRSSKTSTELTKEMISDGSWKTTTFKKYNFAAKGKEPVGGYLHPIMKVRQEFREIFLELGFQEMETQQWVENCFWNFDALFVPQKHPARDSQDTFFVSKPPTAISPPVDYVRRVKSVHETGYQNDWAESECHKNVLRTHTTAVSSWVLYHLAQCAPKLSDGSCDFKPGRFFSIDRVFRNEEMDRTHLCEFHQIEGFVIDRNLSLANMMHTLHQFFKRVGVEQLRFKPAFNPYTEPSMEIFGFHTGLKKWMEVGNSGMFRPEMLKPMGFGDDVTAIAWGLSLERPTMIKYDITNIHDLFGHKVDLRFIRRAKIARY